MAFDVNRISTLELKFKRHKVTFDYDSKNQAIVFGKSKNKNQKLALGIMFILLAIMSMLAIIFFKLPLGRMLNLIISGGLAALGLKYLADFRNLKVNNKTKIITKNSIIISDSPFLKDEIDEIDFEIISDDSVYYTGVLSIYNKSKKIPLVTILDKNNKFIKNDMIFLKELILDFMNDK